MTTATPEELLRPDARMVGVLAGETGFAPPTFTGQAGLATDGTTTVLALRSEHTVVFVSSKEAVSRALLADALGLPREAVLTSAPSKGADTSSAAETVARAAIGGLREARVEWTSGRAPTPGWAASSDLWIGRIASAEGEIVGTLVLAPISCSTSSAVDIIVAATGAPAVVIAAAEGIDEAGAAVGRALGHAAIAALAVLPPAGNELYLDRLVESGAPLAVWRPRAARGDGESEVVVEDGTWRIGPAVIRFDEDGKPLAVTLPAGPYAG